MDYFKEQFRNFDDLKSISKNFSEDEQKIIRDIKKYSCEDPLMDIYISDLLAKMLKDIPLSDDELKNYVHTATFFIKKGDSTKILERLVQLKNK